MTITEFAEIIIAIGTLFGAGFVLIQIWDTKAVRRQDLAHEQAKEISNLKEARVDALFAGMAAAMKQMQDRQKEDEQDRRSISDDFRSYRSELNILQTSSKLEMQHIKEFINELREEVKSVARDVGEGRIRISGGPKY